MVSKALEALRLVESVYQDRRRGGQYQTPSRGQLHIILKVVDASGRGMRN